MCAKVAGAALRVKSVTKRVSPHFGGSGPEPCLLCDLPTILPLDLHGLTARRFLPIRSTRRVLLTPLHEKTTVSREVELMNEA